MAETRKKNGRPTIYTDELAKEICETIASTGSGLITLCNQNPHWPQRETIYAWVRENDTFSHMYHKAKKDQVTAFVDDIIQISDDTSRDDKAGKNDETVCNTEWVARSRLRVDTRKWLAAKLLPRLYGDNTLARELADEIEEFKQMLKIKGALKNGGEEVDSEGN